MRILLAVLMAAKLAGVSMPDRATADGKPLVLNGMGVREATVFKVDVYVAGLYLEKASSNANEILGSNQVKLLQLRFVRDVDKGDIVKAWHEGFKSDATVPLAQLQPGMDQLDAWMPAKLKDGDTLAFTFIPGKGVQVAINDAAKGTIPGDDFGRSLLSIWLGPKPPGGDLKRGLLGQH
jgi:hypothetical protein